MSPSDRLPVELHVLSDSTGETAARLVLALEAQFLEQTFVTVRHPRVESVADLELAVERMRGLPAVAIYTLVEPDLRAAMRMLARRARIHYCDLLAQPLLAVAKVTGEAAQMTPRARPPLDEHYFRRVAAIEFAVKSDDGLGRGLAQADVVLVGVSRTSKTPLSIYLGFLGWKAANVPLVKHIEPPAELFRIDASRIVGVTIDAERLAEIRSERIQQMGGDRKLREPERDLRGARVRSDDPPQARVPGGRRLGALDRGDRVADHPRGRAANPRSDGPLKPKPPVSPQRWALWYVSLATALFIFYGLFTPFWFGLRSLAWLAEFRDRRRKQA